MERNDARSNDLREFLCSPGFGEQGAGRRLWKPEEKCDDRIV